MKKMYCLVDRDFGEVIMASTTRRPLEEELCDMFMDTFQAEMQEAADNHWINVEEPSRDCRVFANDCWNHIMSWFKEIYDIQKVWLS